MKKEQKPNSQLSNKDSEDIYLLKRALQREKKARQAAERLLEDKSKELYDASMHLKEVNGQLEALLNQKGSKIDSAFVNIIDPYVVMDLSTKVINMNQSAKEFLGYDHKKETLRLSKIVHPDYIQYTAESFQILIQVGIIKNYNAKIFTKIHGEKFVNINASLIYDKNGNPIAAQGIIRDITREKEIQQLLVDQKKQQDIIVENSSLGILLIVKDKIVKANKSFIELIGGYDLNQLKEHSLNDLSEVENEGVNKKFLSNNENGDQDRFTEIRKFHTKDGGSFFGKTSMSTVRDQNGEIEYKVAIIEDITNDKIAEEKIKASEERLTNLIKNLQSGVLLEDENRKIVLANQRFCDLFDIPVSVESLKGISTANDIQKYLQLFVNPDRVSKRTGYILKKREVVLSDELELRDGRIFERDFIPLFVDNQYKGHLWSYNDVTLKKNYRRNLEMEKEKYAGIIANMNLGLLELDEDEIIILANQSYCNMIGLAMPEVINKHAEELIQFTPESKLKLMEYRRKSTTTIEDSIELEVVLKNKEKRYWLVSAAPRYNDAGKIIGSVAIHLDITDQKSLELQKAKLVEELEDSNKGLQEYAHIVSHDLKSPLRSVSALASWLYEDYKDKLDENGQYNLRMMQEKVEGMDKLIDGILKYSTVGRDQYEESNVDVNEVIKEIEEIIYIPENVRIQTANKLPVIKADRTKIHQLLQNFLSNAVVNIDKPVGIVEIESKDLGMYWQFSVKDNGVGIPKEYHEKIFQIFQSIGNNERSTGIGLSIVKKIIDRYQGKVWLESEVGAGTTFYFTLKKNIK